MTRTPAQAFLPLVRALLWLPISLQAESPSAKSGAQQAGLPIRAGVLSSKAEPGATSSQGLSIRILRETGLAAAAVSAEAVKAGALDGRDILIIGGGCGTKFNTSLGRDGCAKVEEFVRRGGGVLASCAGGYSFVRGHNEALRFLVKPQIAALRLLACRAVMAAMAEPSRAHAEPGKDPNVPAKLRAWHAAQGGCPGNWKRA